MHRFKIQSITPEHFVIGGEEFHHLQRVLRLEIGDRLLGYDNSGHQWLGQIASMEKGEASCGILREEKPEVEAGTKVTLVMGLAKGEKMEWVIQKGTELGMAGFVPLRTQRSVLQLEGKKAAERVARWQKIACEAVKQSHRVVEPIVQEVVSWQELPSLLPASTQWLIPYEGEKTLPLRTVLTTLNPKDPIAIIIGSEGGFAPEEVAWAKEHLKASVVSLGPRILRTETAALAALVQVLASFGDLG